MSDERPAMTDGLGRSFKVTYHYSPELTSHIRALIAGAIRAERGRVVAALRAECDEAQNIEEAYREANGGSNMAAAYEAVGDTINTLADRLENLP